MTVSGHRPPMRICARSLPVEHRFPFEDGAQHLSGTYFIDRHVKEIPVQDDEIGCFSNFEGTLVFCWFTARAPLRADWGRPHPGSPW